MGAENNDKERARITERDGRIDGKMSGLTGR